MEGPCVDKDGGPGSTPEPAPKWPFPARGCARASPAGPRPRTRLTARGFKRRASLEELSERAECLKAPSRERAVVSLWPLLCLTPFSTWGCVSRALQPHCQRFSWLCDGKGWGRRGPLSLLQTQKTELHPQAAPHHPETCREKSSPGAPTHPDPDPAMGLTCRLPQGTSKPWGGRR